MVTKSIFFSDTFKNIQVVIKARSWNNNVVARRDPWVCPKVGEPISYMVSDVCVGKENNQSAAGLGAKLYCYYYFFFAVSLISVDDIWLIKIHVASCDWGK